MTWRNWSHSVTATPDRVVAPTSYRALREVVTKARGTRVKPVGSGHSFSPIAVAPGIQVDLSNWTGVTGVDRDRRRLTVRSGTRLWQLPALLRRHGWAMENLGDVDRQSISGAVATGTHGTGLAFGSISSQVVGLRLITGTGEELEVTDDDPDLLDAVRVSLGALGMITEITLQCVPAFDLDAVETHEPWDEVAPTFAQRAREHDHLEMFAFGHAREVLVKTQRRVQPGTVPHTEQSALSKFVADDVVGTAALAAMCQVGRFVPQAIPKLNQVAARAWGGGRQVRPSHEVYATSRKVRFTETEYAVDLEKLPEALDRVRHLFTSGRFAVTFPIEVRTVAADTAWLAPSHGRETGYIAVHQHISTSHREYFSAVEQIMGDLGGRPHWGKMHTRTRAELEPLYPRYADFIKLRNELDPNRVFTNAYLDLMFGV